MDCHPSFVVSLLLLLAAVFGDQDCDPNSGDCDDSCSPPSYKLTIPEDVVLLLGITGVGKTTLALVLSNQDSGLRVEWDGNKYIFVGSDIIGAGVKSVTKIPRAMTDSRTGAHFLDCPGFEDTRSPCVEVTIAYFMKEVARQARRVKVVLLAPYFAVSGSSRTEFLKMLSHAARLLKGVDKLQHSVTLAVSKIEAYERRRGSDGQMLFAAKSDAQVEDDVVDFLTTTMKPFLNEKIKTAEDSKRDEYRRARNLVDIFLSKDQRNENRIVLFRAPAVEGPIKDNKDMQHTRAVLSDMVQNKLRYAAVRPSDFGTTVSGDTEAFALRMARWLSEDIVDELSALGLAVADAKYRSAYDPEDVPGTAERLQRAADDVRRLGAHVKGSSNVQEFCDRVNDTGASTPKEVEQVAKVVKMCRQIVALEVVSEEAIVGRSALRELWVRPFQEAADELEARKDWVRFLAAMYDRLSKHDVQASRRALGPFADLGAIEAKAQALGLPAKLRPAAVNLQDANALVSMVSREPERECNDDSGELVVRGESVSVSEALATGCGGGARTVHIYATNTVFVDADVALPGGRLVIVAPRWEVLGSPKIDLNGQPGPDAGGKPGPPDSGSRGADGEAGGPGSPGGSFLGVGATFIGNKPRVTADGGRGGRGRDGGDGGSGSPGGGDGGDGGDGGVGGLGGQRGRALFVNLVGQVFQNDVSTADGPRGDGGRGGYGGTSTVHSARRRRRRRQDEAPSWIPSAISAVADVAKALINRPDRHGGEQAPAPPPPPVYHDGRPGRDNSAGSPEPPAQPLPTLWQSVPPRVLQHAESSADHPYRRRDIQRYLQELRASTAFMTLA